MEGRAKDAKQAATDASLKELRRGWCLGEKSFAEKILEALAEVARPKRKRGSVLGEAACAHDVAEAERLAISVLLALGVPADAAELLGKGKWVEEAVQMKLPDVTGFSRWRSARRHEKAGRGRSRADM